MAKIGNPTLRLQLFFEPAPQDLESSGTYLTELEELRALANAKGVSLNRLRSNPADVLSFLTLQMLGQFVVDHADKVAPLLIGLLGTWLGARNSRKVRLKVGDIEVEARTPEDVEKLFARVQEIQQRNQPKVIHEP